MRNQLRTLMDVAALNSRVVMEMKPVPVVVGNKDGVKSDAAKEVNSSYLHPLLSIIYTTSSFFCILNEAFKHPSHSSYSFNQMIY